MITIRLLLQPGRLAQPVDDNGRPLASALPGPVIGSAEPIRILFLDGDLHAVDPPGFTDAPALRLSIAQDWTPATPPLYVTNALARSTVGVYDLADPSGTYTAEAVAALGSLAALPCAWEISAYGGDPATEAVWTAPLSIIQFQLPLRNRSDSLPDPTILPPADLRGPPGPAGSPAFPMPAKMIPSTGVLYQNTVNILTPGIGAGPLSFYIDRPAEGINSKSYVWIVAIYNDGNTQDLSVSWIARAPDPFWLFDNAAAPPTTIPARKTLIAVIINTGPSLITVSHRII